MLEQQCNNIQIALAILRDEIDGNVQAALKKLTSDYSMTWMYKGRKGLFPSTRGTIRKELDEVYHIKGREYKVYSIASGKQTVMLELIESYPRDDGKGRYQTPMVLVLDFDKGKIRAGRHYCDPDVSHLRVPKLVFQRAYRKKKSIRVLS